MATVVNVPKDTRNEDIGNSLVSSIDQIVAERKKKQIEDANQNAFKSAVNAPDFKTAFQELMTKADPGTLSNPQSLAAMVASIGEIHQDTKPGTPVEWAKIDADFKQAIAQMHMTSDIAKQGRDSAEGIARENRDQRREQPDITERAKGYGENIKKAIDAGASASRMMTQFDVLDEVEKGVKTGTFAKPALRVVNTLKELGLDNELIDKAIVGNAAGATAMEAAAGKLVLEGIGGSLGVGFSNADRQLIEATQQSLSNSQEGNALLSVIGRAGAKRAMEISKTAVDMQNAGASQASINAKIVEMQQQDVIDAPTKAKIQAIMNTEVDLKAPPGGTAAPTATTTATTHATVSTKALQSGDTYTLPNGRVIKKI